MPGRVHVLLSLSMGLEPAGTAVMMLMRAVLCAAEALPRVRVRRPPRPVAPSPGEDPRAGAYARPQMLHLSRSLHCAAVTCTSGAIIRHRIR